MFDGTSKPTTHEEIVDALLARIRSEVKNGADPIFTDANLWLSDDPRYEIPSSARHHVYAVVCPTDGQTNHDEFGASGSNVCVEYTAFTVVIHSALRLAQKGKPGIVLTHPTGGLWPIKRKLLKALHGQHLLDGDDQSLLTQQMQYVHGERPFIQGQAVGDLALTFSAPFLWDLS